MVGCLPRRSTPTGEMQVLVGYDRARHETYACARDATTGKCTLCIPEVSGYRLAIWVAASEFAAASRRLIAIRMTVYWIRNSASGPNVGTVVL